MKKPVKANPFAKAPAKGPAKACPGCKDPRCKGGMSCKSKK